uniref:ATP synthase F0 subunit 8 n=1 Tax=Sphindus dubius TaxID=295944 RepID=A0A0S2MQM1_9CUCU|nr:ATP synthase F0 subunit 8 [Sphindus dubius]
MPQMMPMNWLLLYISFITILLIFISIHYFNFFYSIKHVNKKKQLNITWKW